MSVSIIALTEADRDRLLAVDGAAFFFDPDTAPAESFTAHFDWDRTYGASPDAGGTLVGVYTSFDMAVTVPGPLGAAAAGADAGAVLGVGPPRPPSSRRAAGDGHPPPRGPARPGGGPQRPARRRGRDLRPVRLRRRLPELDLTLPRGTAFTAPALEAARREGADHPRPGRLGRDGTAVQELHLRCATTTLGAVTRPDRMTRNVLVDRPRTRQGRETDKVLFAAVDGQLTGYARFHRTGTGEDGVPQGTVSVPEMAAADPASLLALARRLVDFDLTTTTRIGGRGADDPMIWWAGAPARSGRRRTTASGCGWSTSARPCRSAATPPPPTWSWTSAEDACPWNHRRWRLTAGDDDVGRCVPTEDPADLRLPVQALAAAYLGTRTLSAQARRGCVERAHARLAVGRLPCPQRRPGAGRRRDVLSGSPSLRRGP